MKQITCLVHLSWSPLHSNKSHAMQTYGDRGIDPRIFNFGSHDVDVRG